MKLIQNDYGEAVAAAGQQWQIQWPWRVLVFVAAAEVMVVLEVASPAAVLAEWWWWWQR